MIHIIDPRTQLPIPTPTLSSRDKVRKSTPSFRYINDRNLHCADLVAIRTGGNRYYIVKNYYDRPKPGSETTKAGLRRCMERILASRG